MGGPAPGTEAAREAFGGPRHRRLRLARGSPFVGGKNATLGRILGEKGVVPTAETAARLDALPDNFAAFITAPERFFARPEAEAA